MNNVPWCFVLLILATSTSVLGRHRLLNTIFIRYYNKTVGDHVDVPLDQTLDLLSEMDNNKTTVLYIHGFAESTESNSVNTVVRAYLNRDDHNILAADYRNISQLPYLQVILYARDIGAVLAGTLNDMVAAGLNPKKIHVVGHSLGAQVSSYLAKKTNFKLTRITGLDPAGPLFNVIEPRLSAKDADFVDIIHTDYGFYGIAKRTGSVDFFPNGGRRLQPGCPVGSPILSSADFCSHHRSWRFYAESLRDEGAFIASKCSSQYEFAKGTCKNNQKVPMGFATSSDTLVTCNFHPELANAVRKFE